MKAIAIYEEILDKIDEKSRANILRRSNIGQTILRLGDKTIYEHESTRNIRHGYMALIVRLATLIQNHTEKPVVQEYVDTLGDAWKNFVEGELKQSNILYTRSLGGQ